MQKNINYSIYQGLIYKNNTLLFDNSLNVNNIKRKS